MQDDFNLLAPSRPAGKQFLAPCAALSRHGGRRGAPGVVIGVPLHWPLISVLLHYVLIVAVLRMESRTPQLHLPRPVAVIPYPRTEYANHIVYVWTRLPEVTSHRGAPSGAIGKSGGMAKAESSQEIRVARGSAIPGSIVDTRGLALTEKRLSANLMQLDGPKPVLVVAAPPVKSTHLPASKTSTQDRQEQQQAQYPDRQLDKKMPDKVRLPARVTSVIAENSESTRDLLSRTVNSDSRYGVGALIITSRPGTEPGLVKGRAGSTAMSSATSGTGLGLSGMGTSLAPATGEGSGTATQGTATGSGRAGVGISPDSQAQNGSSIVPGPGGADEGNPAASAQTNDVLVSNGQYYVPSFAHSAAAVAPTTGKKKYGRLSSVVVVATPNSSKMLAPELARKAHQVYTMYLQTRRGAVVMQFVETGPAVVNAERELAAPEPIFADFPPDFPVVATVTCVLDTDGQFRQLKLLKTSTPELNSRLIEILRKWYFRPAMNKGHAIAVSVSLGIGAE